MTGATGYTGKYITKHLLALGRKVKTLTGHPHRVSPFGDEVQAVPFNFDHPEELTESLRGVATLYNTYWVRFSYQKVTFDLAVENTKILLKAAKQAGVKKFVHISVTNPDKALPLPYYRGKALLEQVVSQSGLPYAVIRPTLIFGPEDILINNIAWCLRKFPFFAVPGAGDYRIQPIFCEDVAEIAVAAAHRDRNEVLDAAASEVFTFDKLVHQIAEKIGSKSKVIHLPPQVALSLSSLVGRIVRDVILTPEELKGLMSNLLVSAEPPKGKVRLSDWLEKNAATVGAHYASELDRHFR